MKRNRIRKGIIIAALVIILGNIVLLDFQDLSWARNQVNYMGITAMIMVILSMSIFIKYDQN